MNFEFKMMKFGIKNDEFNANVQHGITTVLMGNCSVSLAPCVLAMLLK